MLFAAALALCVFPAGASLFPEYVTLPPATAGVHPGADPRADDSVDVPLTWKGKTYTTEAIPPDLPPAAKAAVVRFAVWAAETGYRMDFDAQGRVLLITPQKRSRLAESLRIVGKAESWFDTALPAPKRAKPKEAKVADAPAAPSKPPSDPIPEDPESPPPKPVGSGPGTGGSAPSPLTEWGSGSIQPDSVTAVLIVTGDEADFGTLVDALAKEHGYLDEWVGEAKKHTGFTLEEPLCGAYAENAAGQEEWNGDHELINRVIQLLTLRRFGQQPNWLVQGIAWDGEIATDGLVYCFPYRKEFVFTAEHGGWPNEAKLIVKGLAKGPEVADLCAWKRGTWDGARAKLAWGVVHHLIGQGQGKLSAALEELRVERAVRDRRQTGPSTWERIKGFELPADVQDAALRAHLGKDVMQDAAASIRAGRVIIAKDKPTSDKPEKPDKADKSQKTHKAPLK